MRLAGILASGETPTADEANDALKVLNDLLENWSTENLTVWSQANQTFNAVSGTATYAIGPGATWNTTRPIRISGGYASVNGADFPISMWGQEEYNTVAVKTVGGIPERCLYINDVPNGSVTLYPVPAAASGPMTITLTIDRVLTFPLTLVSVLAYPPGYERALRYAMAVALGPEYQLQTSPLIVATAKASKADIKRANKIQVRAGYDNTLMGQPAFAYYQRGY